VISTFGKATHPFFLVKLTHRSFFAHPYLLTHICSPIFAHPYLLTHISGVSMTEIRKPSAIARAIAFAIEQPGEVDINEMTIRPTQQEL
jgi:hypothetical protein